MAPKRKSSTMALMHPRGVANQSEQPPRRSGRKFQKSAVGTYVENGSDEDGSALPSRPLNSEKGVERAMSDLKQLEGNLKESNRDQKRAVSIPLSGSRISQSTSTFTPESSLASSRTRSASIKQINPQENAAHRKRIAKESAQAKAVSGIPGDPESGDEVMEDVSAVKLEGARPPPVNSEYLPLPWKGRLGYACLNTYLRVSNPPVFSSRTCRIASIIEHRYPLHDPSQPEHPTRNRPDKEKQPDIARGQRYVENLGLANARDIVKMLRWNDKYGIRFMRLSSEMFPFASHAEYGYKLAPFASEVLAEAGRVAGELGHRLTTHPGQFTQLGSPRKEVVTNAIRDLEYHNEMLSLLKLPEQANRDAVMILHMGGTFGDKEATLQRFRENYAKLSEGIKARLVLENDDVSWSVHDLLPICEELNIPMVLDFHHHNIIFDHDRIREGTKDIVDLFPRIRATWERKRITQKMHYSEPCPDAITGRQRRKHSPRVMTLPPCADDMDLMIEAKDKEQAVFELMRTYRLPGWDSFSAVVPYEREDENKPVPKAKAPKKKGKAKKGADADEDVSMDEAPPLPPPEIPPEEVGMGGPNRRVYWPVGMEEWLRPKKREVKRKPKGVGELAVGVVGDEDDS